MLTKFLDFDKIYNFCFNEKIVTQKNLSLQAFVIATLVNSFGRSTLESDDEELRHPLIYLRKCQAGAGGGLFDPLLNLDLHIFACDGG